MQKRYKIHFDRIAISHKTFFKDRFLLSRYKFLTNKCPGTNITPSFYSMMLLNSDHDLGPP